MHHLFNIAIRELVATIPPDSQKDERWLEVSPLERGFVLLQEYDFQRVIFKLESGL